MQELVPVNRPPVLTCNWFLSQGYLGDERAFIATQGPMVNTVNDFWLMAWQEAAPVIVMITKLKEKNEVTSCLSSQSFSVLSLPAVLCIFSDYFNHQIKYRI